MVSGQLQRQVQSGHLVLGRQHHSWIYRHMGKCQRPNSWRQGMTVLLRTHITTRSFHYACCLGRWLLPYCLYIPCASIPVHLTPQVCIWAHTCLLYTWNMHCGCMLTEGTTRSFLLPSLHDYAPAMGLHSSGSQASFASTLAAASRTTQLLCDSRLTRRATLPGEVAMMVQEPAS